MAAFIFFLSGDLLTKGYLALNSLFMVSSTIMLSKTLRDEHETAKLATAQRGATREVLESAVDANAIRIFAQEIYECDASLVIKGSQYTIMNIKNALCFSTKGVSCFY